MEKTKIKKHNNRILKISEDSQQITMPDSRYYKRNGEYYPSITYILNYYPKGTFFENWLKKVGYSSEFIIKKASEDGTMLHNMVERFLLNEEINLLDKNNNAKYSIEVWQMFLNFVEFWERYKPILIDTEIHLFSDELKIAGTCDLVCEINKELWIIDLKTSNQMHTSYELQVAVYGKCYEECYNIRPDHFGILWLKSGRRKASKDKMIGRGWEMVESSRSFEKNLEIFKAVKTLFDLENPKISPIITEFKTSIKRNN